MNVNQISKKKAIDFIDYLLKESEKITAVDVSDEAHDYMNILRNSVKRNYSRIKAIKILLINGYSDEALDLSRSLCEDYFSLIWISNQEKEEESSKFWSFFHVQLYEESLYRKKLSISQPEAELLVFDELKKKWQEELGKTFTHQPTGDIQRSWSGKTLEKMLNDLFKSNSIEPDWYNRIGLFYILGNRKNHFNPVDLSSYSSNKKREEENMAAYHQASIFSILFYISILIVYIDELSPKDEKNLSKSKTQLVKRKNIFFKDIKSQLS